MKPRLLVLGPLVMLALIVLLLMTVGNTPSRLKPTFGGTGAQSSAPFVSNDPQSSLADSLRTFVRHQSIEGLVALRLHDSAGGITIYWHATAPPAAVQTFVGSWRTPATFRIVPFAYGRVAAQVAQLAANATRPYVSVGPTRDWTGILVTVLREQLPYAQRYFASLASKIPITVIAADMRSVPLTF